MSARPSPQVRPPYRRYISLSQLLARDDVPERYKNEVAGIVCGDGYGKLSKAGRAALDRARIGGVTRWDWQLGEEDGQP